MNGIFSTAWDYWTGTTTPATTTSEAPYVNPAQRTEGERYYNALWHRRQTLTLRGAGENSRTRTLMMRVQSYLQQGDRATNDLNNGRISGSAFVNKMKSLYTAGWNDLNKVEALLADATLPEPTIPGAPNPTPGPGSTFPVYPVPSGEIPGAPTHPPFVKPPTGQIATGFAAMQPWQKWAIYGSVGLVGFLLLRAAFPKRGGPPTI